MEDSELIEVVTTAYAWTDWIVGPLLFLATAAVVAWQNSRITVLYDLCGVLEPAYRMSLGDRPYLDSEIVATPWKLDADGMLPISDKPGLGLELNRDAVAKYTQGERLLD